jgi:hypothetical protein
MTSLRNVNIRKNSAQKIPATFGTLNFLIQLRYQTISSFTVPEPSVLFQSRNMGHYTCMSPAPFLLQRKQPKRSAIDLVVLRTMAATWRSWNIASATQQMTSFFDTIDKKTDKKLTK